MTDTTSTPETTQPAATPAEKSPKRSRKRTILLSGAGVLAALVLAGGGIAVGAAIADDEGDDRDDTAESVSQDSDQTVRGASSADTLTDVIQSAASQAEGVPTELEASTDGAWEVQFTTDTGDESDVRVSSDGTAAVVGTDAADPDDTAPAAQLDDATVQALVAAALEAADGEIVHLDVDDNAADIYEATVLTGDGTRTNLSFDASFAVTKSETDNDDD